MLLALVLVRRVHASLLTATLVSAVAALAAHAQPVASRKAPSPAMSRRAIEGAQRSFERYRRQLLPVSDDVGPDCEERVGRFCYWLDAGGEAPAERPDVARARRALIDSLGAASERDPSDGWVTGQRVRYLVEEGDPGRALAVARGCADGWWCHALRGYALHAAERIEEAAFEFDEALTAMPAAERCRFTDVSPWLEGGERSRFEHLPCGEGIDVSARDAAAASLWRAAEPFAARPTGEARVVFLARRTAARLLAAAARPEDEPWGDDMEELGMRYGFAAAWARARGRVTDPWPRIVGHEPLHALPYAPRGHAVARFPVAGADTVLALVPRASRFRRGDSLLVVVAYDATRLRPDDGSDRALQAWAALLTSATDGVRLSDSAAHPAGSLALRAPNADAALHVDAVDRVARRAARASAFVPHLDADAGVSDLLFVRADRVRGHTEMALDSLLDAVDPRRAVPAGEPVGIYWEAYRAATEAESLTVELRIIPTNVSLGVRLAAALHLRELPTPSTIKWSNPPHPELGEGHTLVLETSGLPDGLYRLELWLRGRGPDAVAVAPLRVER